MPTKHADELPNPTPIELNRIVPLAEASRLSSLSVDTLRDQFPEKIVHLSPKRAGMRVGQIPGVFSVQNNLVVEKN
jgi:hypothetical protein